MPITKFESGTYGVHGREYESTSPSLQSPKKIIIIIIIIILGGGVNQ